MNSLSKQSVFHVGQNCDAMNSLSKQSAFHARICCLLITGPFSIKHMQHWNNLPYTHYSSDTSPIASFKSACKTHFPLWTLNRPLYGLPARARARVCVCVRVRACVCMRVCVFVYVCVCVRARARTHASMYVCWNSDEKDTEWNVGVYRFVYN